MEGRGLGRSRSWSAYLADFHRRNAGITEATLGGARSGGLDPYRWLLDPLPGSGRFLDLACGSGPVPDRWAPVGRRPVRWVGVDLSAAELALAARGADTSLVRADAGLLPFGDGAFAAVVCSMAIMILRPLGTVLAEMGRVLEPGGTAALLLPGSRPLTARDLGRYGRLMAALRRTHLAYPNDRAMTRLRVGAAAAGLRIVDDRRRRFALPIGDAAAAERFVRSLYLPAIGDRRVEAAIAVAARWEGTGLGVPLRRIVLRRHGGHRAGLPLP